MVKASPCWLLSVEPGVGWCLMIPVGILPTYGCFCLLPSNICFWQGLESQGTRFGMSKFSQHLMVVEMHVYCKAPSHLCTISGCHSAHGMNAQTDSPQTDTRPSPTAAGRWLHCFGGGIFPPVGVKSRKHGLTDIRCADLSLAELVGMLT